MGETNFFQHFFAVLAILDVHADFVPPPFGKECVRSFAKSRFEFDLKPPD